MLSPLGPFIWDCGQDEMENGQLDEDKFRIIYLHGVKADLVGCEGSEEDEKRENPRR